MVAVVFGQREARRVGVREEKCGHTGDAEGVVVSAHGVQDIVV